MSSASATTASHGDELCFLCGSQRTKKCFSCIQCRANRRDNLREKRFVCAECSRRSDLRCPSCHSTIRQNDIVTDTDLRSNADFTCISSSYAWSSGVGRLTHNHSFETHRRSIDEIHNCFQCGYEDSGWFSKDQRFYCRGCWDAWTGKIPTDIRKLANQYPRSQQSVYDVRQLVGDAALESNDMSHISVQVVDRDCLAVAYDFSRERQRVPVLLCNASKMSPGGVAGKNGRSQLGEICRSTTFLQVADKSTWPRSPNRQAYLPQVRVFQVEGAPVEEPFEMAILAAPTLQARAHPSIENADLWFNSLDYEAKVNLCARGILRICDMYEHHEIVLGAWSCGDIRCNPPDKVASAFRHALAELRRDTDLTVTFAIKRDNKSLEAFRRVFGQ